MSRIAITANDLPAELRALEGQVRESIIKGARAAARRGRALLVRRTPKDQGHLKAAWRDTAGSGAAGVLAEIMNDAPYAGVVEAGAGPHPVSPEGQLAIYEWVRRHFGVVRVGRGRYTGWAKGAPAPGKVRSKLSGPLGELNMSAELVKIAQAIIHRIETKGQRPTYFIRTALPEISGYASEEVAREFRELAKRGRLS